MNAPAMTSLQRVLTTLGHREPDRVPLFLLVTMHGARELGLPIEAYYADADHVVEGQCRLLRKFRGDSVSAFMHASLEVEAFGGSTLFAPDGPPLAGAPPLATPEAIDRLRPPAIDDAPGLQRTLAATRGLKASVGDTVPIVGVAISPFSLPVMQLGFERYLEIIYRDPDRFLRLMDVNVEFCVAWANAQLAAGATAICYFDPVSSPTIVPPALYRRTGRVVAQRTLPRITGATVTHLASGRCLPIVDDLAQSGTAAIGVSTLEDLAAVKRAAAGRVSLIGNLNAVAMRRWTRAEAEAAVKEAIRRAGPGGGFILSDNHGEIPWQVPDAVLLALRDAADRWGRYPLDWIADEVLVHDTA